MKLGVTTLPAISNSTIIKPPVNYAELPVKVLQFGTGVLLRGLPDYLIDKANRQGVFNGRVVVVKSTSAGKTDAFAEQDNLYTVMIKGIRNEQIVDEISINSSISHVLTAASQWEEILKEADNPQLSVIISNTTEVGIRLVNESIEQNPPASFPAKLLALLYRRYKTLGGSKAPGLVIIPTELLPDNANVLKSIILELIAFNQLGGEFKNWVLNNNFFCNSLVDRIVPGKPDEQEMNKIKAEVGYQDDLLIMAEPYALWAIEGDEHVKSVLSFAQADEGVIVTTDIEMYRELKLRLLNGTHSLSCAMAILMDFDYVNEATYDTVFSGFLQEVMTEIRFGMPYQADTKIAAEFSASVLDRFKNPYIKHLWVNIAQQYTSKLITRVMPVLKEYIKLPNHIPQNIAKGFAAYLFLMSKVVEDNGAYYLNINGKRHPFNDEKAAYLKTLFDKHPIHDAVSAIFASTEIWGNTALNYPQFTEAVQIHLDVLIGSHSLL